MIVTQILPRKSVIIDDMSAETQTFGKLIKLLKDKKLSALRRAWESMNEVDIAWFISDLNPEMAALAFRTLPKQMAADVFAEVEPETQEIIVNSANDQELAAILRELAIDETVDLLEEMPAMVVKRVLKNTGSQSRQLINQFLNYQDNTAGSIMTAEFTDLRATMTVAEAIATIRKTSDEKENIYTCYVIDEGRVLEGVVTVKDLLLAKDKTLVSDLMETDIISVETNEDQEVVAQLFTKYGFLALPVVDHEKRLVGVITVDDVLEIVEEEATEDFEVMSGIAKPEKPYLKTGVFDLAKSRIAWLMVLMISGMITGEILGEFEAAIAAMPLLVTFIPMLTDTGGNAGSQSSTLIIRGLATGDIELSDWLKIWWRELRVSLLVGVVLGGVNFVRLILTYPGQTMVALTVSLTMLLVVVMAKTVGGLLPILAKKMRVDPAIMAAPLVTTIVDAAALAVYFGIAVRLLPL